MHNGRNNKDISINVINHYKSYSIQSVVQIPTPDFTIA